MKKIKLITVIICLFVTFGLLFINGCKKDKTTGHLNVLGVISPLPQLASYGYCVDYSKSPTNVYVSLYSDNGTLIKNVNGSNNTTFDFGELNPGTYSVKITGTLYFIANCYSGSPNNMEYSTSKKVLQIVANEDQTITCGW